MNAICLSIDRLHIGQLGFYGNAWVETPSFDRLACESFTFDQALVGSPEIKTFYRHVWQGRHPLQSDRTGVATDDFLKRLSQADISTALLTDERTLATSSLAGSFDELIELDPPERIEPADEIGSTHLAQCFARIIEWLGAVERPFMLWVHLASLGTCWDAPYALRERYAESGDPDPPRSAEVPRLLLPDDYDPDVLLGITQSYAAQVSLLDVCLGALLESIDENSLGRETLLALLSPRGFPLGEHRSVGAWNDALHGELVHVPMMVRFPEGLGAAGRSQTLVTPADLRPTLREWWSLDDLETDSIDRSLMPIVRGMARAVRDRLLLAGTGSERALRTPAWYARLTEPPELYVKPDDRWEVNDVANRCAEVVEELRVVADDYEDGLLAGRTDSLVPLDEILQSGLE